MSTAIDTFKPVRRLALRGALTVVALGATVALHASSDRPVSPPCEGNSAQPVYAPVGAPPNVQIWRAGHSSAAPALLTCLAWPPEIAHTLAAVAGTFQVTDGAAALLARFGDVSGLLRIRYWSTTEQTWRPLILAATPVTNQTGSQSRGNFTRVELESGQELYLSQRDSRVATDVVYRMRLREHGPDRFVMETENVTSVKWFGLPLLSPGELRAVYFLEQRPAGTWSYYALTTTPAGGWLPAGRDKSYINRVVAMYRYVAGIPTDLEPPPAR